MYGNVDASLRWRLTTIKYLTGKEPEGMGLKLSKADPCVVYKRVNGETVSVVGITVDDSLMTGKAEEMSWFKEKVKKKFNITDLGQLKKHLGVRYSFEEDEKGDKIVRV